MATMSCNHCGAETSGTVPEILAWDKAHYEYCPYQNEPQTEPEPTHHE